MIGSGIGTWLLIRTLGSLKKVEPNNIEMKPIEDADIRDRLAEHFP